MNFQDSTFIWGLFFRGLGLMYFIALVQLWHQALPMAGSRGINPVTAKLAQIKRDYPGIRKWILFPTLLWLGASDKNIRGLIVVGCITSLWAIYGGPYAGVALGISWGIYLSLDIAIGLSYPWDCILLEAGFLSFFLPAVHALPAISAVEDPYETVAWAYRLLLFRLMFGFGKFKFSKINLRDDGYFKSFMINIPLPTIPAWYLYKMPAVFFRMVLYLTFLVEIIAPFFIFVNGPLRLVAGGLICVLMLGIWLVSNFGFFNLLTILLCIPLLDVNSSLFAQTGSDVLAHLPVNLIFLFLFVGWFFHFFFNSWCTFTWLHWPSALQVKSGVIRFLLSVYRSLLRFRIMHAYGVFPPDSSPPVKWSPIFEGSADGVHWETIEYKYFFCTEYSKPKFVAPYHPRLDHAVFYDAFGTNDSSLLCSVVGCGDPYEFAHATGMELIMQRLLEGNVLTYSLFGKSVFTPAQPPKWVRVSLYLIEPTSIEERKASGRWWTKVYGGCHIPATMLNQEINEARKIGPELFHWDAVYYRRWSPALKSLLEKGSAGSAAEALLLAEQNNTFTTDFIWNKWLPETGKNWADIGSITQKLKATYRIKDLQQIEMVWSRLALLLSEKLMPYFLQQQKPVLPIDNYFIFGLFCHHIIAKGRSTYCTVFDHPEKAGLYIDDFDPEQAFYSYAVFRHKILAFQAKKYRITLRFSTDVPRNTNLPGFSRLVHFISQQFLQQGPEIIPAMHRNPVNGIWTITHSNQSHKSE